jgi:hypothetical protein
VLNQSFLLWLILGSSVRYRADVGSTHQGNADRMRAKPTASACAQPGGIETEVELAAMAGDPSGHVQDARSVALSQVQTTTAADIARSSRVRRHPAPVG